MKLYYVYILLCSDGLTYTGLTNNIFRRLSEHQKGSDPDSFTYERRPVRLIFNQEFNDVNQAIYFEKKIKKWSSKKKLALAKGDYDMLQILSECRNATHSDYKPKKSSGPRISKSYARYLQVEHGSPSVMLDVTARPKKDK